MGSRGQKRTDIVDELPADKRACSSLEFRPSTSNSSAQTVMSSSNDVGDADMETSSTTSGSSRSETEGERESAYGSVDSGNSLRDYYRHRSSGDQGKFKQVLSNLSQETEESGQLAALTELCELLSFCTDSSLSSLMADSFSPVLVRLARHESNPDIMLLAIRSITYLCDVNPRSSGFLVRHDAVPSLCQKLMSIEYLDVAEQCLQALEKISREQPLNCLQSGAIMAVLNYIDFFSTSLQRVALSIVVNICKKLPSESPSPFMEAVPILCNLLQYDDRQLVESVATCLVKIVERVCQSSDMLDELCKNGLVEQIIHLLDLNSRTTVSQPIYTGLIGLLVKLASGSIMACRSLFELNISSVSRDILSAYDVSHGMSSTSVFEGRSNQVNEILKLLNELLPAIAGEQDVQLAAEKEAFLTDNPDQLQRFGFDLLPVLTQVVNSGVDLFVCYGCLSVINKLVHYIKCDMLLELLREHNISSFLAGVFTRKDHHVLILALQIADKVLNKFSSVLLNSFIKEGVVFAINSLLSQENCAQDMHLRTSQTSGSVPALRCLCFAFDTGRTSTSSEMETCKLEIDSIQNLVKHICSNYFATEMVNREKGLTDILQKLKTLSNALMNLVRESVNNTDCANREEDFHDILSRVISELNGKDPISTFEFVESGIVKSLVNYLSDGHYFDGNIDIGGAHKQMHIIERRFEVIGKLLSSFSDPVIEEFPLTALTRRLQSALSSVENFPLILSDTAKLRHSYATVPHRRTTSYPCLKVQFVKGEGETHLDDFSHDVVNVDPFSNLEDIERYLWPKVSRKKSGCGNSTSQDPDKNNQCSNGPSDSSSSEIKNLDHIESSLPSDLHDMQEIMEHKHPIECGECSSTGMDCPISRTEDSGRKLIFYVEGQQLNPMLTLYQAILQQEVKPEDGVISNSILWTRVQKITYSQSTEHTQSCIHRHHLQDHSASPSQISKSLCHNPLFFSNIASEAMKIEKSSPAYDILYLIRSLEGINQFRFHLMARERTRTYAVGRTDDLDNLTAADLNVSQNEFVNSKLTEKLEQQMRNPLASTVSGMPSWCTYLMSSWPFLFGFEAKCKYFRVAAFGQLPVQSRPSSHDLDGRLNGRTVNSGSYPRKKFLVHRDKILDSAAQMMDLYACKKVVLEVEYSEEVGTGLGPTLEFYTLVSHEFQICGLGMWRGDHMSLGCLESLKTDISQMVVSPLGLFPRPWSPTLSISGDAELSEVTKKFVLLGQIVAKAIQDGRVLDIPFSRAFYRLILGKELSIYDIRSFDPEFGKALLEFQAIVERKRHMESVYGREPIFGLDLSLRHTNIEDLCLDFTLPGYPNYLLNSASDPVMVNLDNLEEYIELIVDATIRSGISRQVEAFKSGFNQVFPIRHLEIFTEDELDRLLCGESDLWNSNDLLDHIKFDHGYTASSPAVMNLLEIIREFDGHQQRAFLQFVTGAPRLPPGGLASLNPKLTIVRKHCSKWPDADLPSVMTCANYLKLPPYSSKAKMKEKLLYAISEGQGSFYLS